MGFRSSTHIAPGAFIGLSQQSRPVRTRDVRALIKARMGPQIARCAPPLRAMAFAKWVPQLDNASTNRTRHEMCAAPRVQLALEPGDELLDRVLRVAHPVRYLAGAVPVGHHLEDLERPRVECVAAVVAVDIRLHPQPGGRRAHGRKKLSRRQRPLVEHAGHVVSDRSVAWPGGVVATYHYRAGEPVTLRCLARDDGDIGI